MKRRHWVRLDNASNIFPAARSDVDPKVFRLGAELDHLVDPALLQEALEETFERFPLYHAVLRRGVFWYYLQDSDLRPQVVAETEQVCAPIYQPDRRTLLFRVVHHRRRVGLEVFHALSDGTGALWFLTDLLGAYARRRFAGEAPVVEEVHELAPDSFAHYFRRRQPVPASHEEDFTREATPAVLTVEEAAREERPVGEGRARRPSGRRRRVHRLRGSRTPDHRTRALELSMPAADVLALAKAEGAAPTMYLTALFFEAIRRTDARVHARSTFAASVPVNLRQFFPSTSARNFFATIRVEHTYGRGDDSIGAVARGLQEAFSAEATEEALGRRLRRLIRVERFPPARIVPRPLKDLLLSAINYANNRSLTVAISNLGRVTLPSPAQDHVGRMLFLVSAVRPQFCAITHGGQLTLGFTSPFVETAHVREFARLLSGAGIEVSLAAARSTEEELAGVGA